MNQPKESLWAPRLIWGSTAENQGTLIHSSATEVLLSLLCHLHPLHLHTPTLLSASSWKYNETWLLTQMSDICSPFVMSNYELWISNLYMYEIHPCCANSCLIMTKTSLSWKFLYSFDLDFLWFWIKADSSLSLIWPWLLSLIMLRYEISLRWYGVWCRWYQHQWRWC